MRATLATIGAGLLLGGCALSPPVQPSGLPRVPRYTNSIQLDFMLGTYRAVAEKAATQPEKAKLVEEACLGWERAVFDLYSTRLYPSILRQSPETLMLEQVWLELSGAVQKHPRPAVCASLVVPVSTTGLPKEVTMGVVSPTATPVASASPTADSPTPAQANPTAQATDASASQQAAMADRSAASSIMPPPSALPAAGLSAPASAATESPVTRERVSLQRLRMALSLPLEPPVNSAATQIDPTLPLQPPALVDLPVLSELANSDIPTVRLRARYHLLGLCTLAVEAADRTTRTLPSTPPGSSVVRPTDPAVCAASSPTEPLRLAQRRLMKSLLTAWRTRYSEPMADFVTSLASFVSRDNPVLDGPRTSR